MSNPKYLPIPKKIPYNIRLPKHLLESLNAYAELTGNTTTDVVIGALNDFIKDKTVFNDYLPDIKGISIRLPMLSSEKSDFYNTNLIGGDSAADIFNEVYGYTATTDAYEILKIPNNLDRFSSIFGYVTPTENIIGKGRHSGIEFVVIPDVYNTYYDNDDVFDTLYCLYFEVETDKLKEIYLIDYLDAINRANDVGNVTLKNNLISCVNDLKYINESLSPYSDVGDGVDLENYVDERLKMIAKRYNTGNIIPLGENIDDAVVTAKVNTHPELYDEFMDDVKDNTERYVDDVIADRVHNIIDYRLSNIGITDSSRDDMKNAIKNKEI